MRSTAWRIWGRSLSTFVPEAWVSTIRPDCWSSLCALDLAPHRDTGAERDRLDFGCRFHEP